MNQAARWLSHGIWGYGTACDFFFLGESCQDSKLILQDLFCGCGWSSAPLYLLLFCDSCWFSALSLSLLFLRWFSSVHLFFFGCFQVSGARACRPKRCPPLLDMIAQGKMLSAPLHVLFNDDQRSKLDCQIVTSNELAACYPFHELL